MNRQWNDANRTTPLLLVAERNAQAANSVVRTLQQWEVRIAVASTVREANEMIGDLLFIGASIDGLVTDFLLVDGFGGSIVRELRNSFPETPAAILVENGEANADVWRHLRGIEVLSRSPQWDELSSWVKDLQVTA